MGSLSSRIGTFFDREVETVDNPWERLATPVYVILCVQLLLIACMFTLGGYRIHPNLADRLPFLAIVFPIGGILLRRYRHQRIGSALEALGLLYLQGVGTLFLLFPLTEWSRPFADEWLAAADAAMGFHWPSFSRLFLDPTVFRIGEFFYYSFEWQALAVVPILAWAGRASRAFLLALAAAIASIITISCYPFAPAAGPAVHYGLDPASWSTFGPFPWQFGPDLAAIKADKPRLIAAEDVFAMVSIPSYHAVAGFLLIWAAWPVRYLREVVLVMSSGMLIATVPVGVHYLVDVVAGGITALAALAIAKAIHARIERSASSTKPA